MAAVANPHLFSSSSSSSSSSSISISINNNREVIDSWVLLKRKLIYIYIRMVEHALDKVFSSVVDPKEQMIKLNTIIDEVILYHYYH